MLKRSHLLTAKLKRELMVLLILASISTFLGLAINQFRDKPLALVYQTKEQRLSKAVSKLSPSIPFSSISIENGGELAIQQVRSFVSEKKGLLIDARPEVFHQIGHLPGAISLPRDDFENSYQKLRPTLEADKSEPLVVYCSSSACEDSELVQQALIRLGYTHVLRFKGGWEEWIQAKLPVDGSSE